MVFVLELVGVANGPADGSTSWPEMWSGSRATLMPATDANAIAPPVVLLQHTVV
jgi:hypothetical protein